MRRLLLGILLLLFVGVSPCIGQTLVSFLGSDGNFYGTSYNGDQFYLYLEGPDSTTVLNSNASGLTLCLERSDGTFLGINMSSTDYPELVKVTFAGQITVLAQFPGKYDDPVCPVIADDGNYYGSAQRGGDYGYGYFYQLTAAGKLNAFYSFTGASDGDGPSVTPLQGSDGNLYDYYGTNWLRYSPTTGLAVYPLSYTPAGESLMEGPDSNFYTVGASPNNGDYAQTILQIQPTGTATPIYTQGGSNDGEDGAQGITNLYLTGMSATPLAAFQLFTYASTDDGDECGASGDLFTVPTISLTGATGDDLLDIGMDEASGDGSYPADADDYGYSLVFAGNGTFYGSLGDITYTDPGTQCSAGQEPDTVATYSVSYPTTAMPLTMSLSKSHVLPKEPSTLTWQVNNAFSDTMKQCFGFGGLSGPVALSGSVTLTPPAAGSYVTSIVCGGTETGAATLVAGNAVLQLGASASQVGAGTPITLTAYVSNAGNPLPTGKVTFLYGATVVGAANLVKGTATLTASTAGIPAGTYNLTAKYAGDANYGAATSNTSAVQIVNKPATKLVLTPASQTLIQGATIAITAGITGTSAYGYPSGTVKFLLGSTVLATEMLYNDETNSSYAYLSEATTGVPAGTYQVTASYSGDIFNLPSTSSSPATIIIQALTPVTLAVSPNPVPAGDSFTLTATVNGKDTPTGTVIFYTGGTQQLASTSVGSGGVAKVTLPSGTLAAGTYQLTAHYAGDANNPAGTSSVVMLTIQ